MRASTVEYHAPARFDDLLEIFVRTKRIGRTSVTFECAAYRMEDDELMVTATQTLVLVDLEQRRAAEIPERVPDADPLVRGRRPGGVTLAPPRDRARERSDPSGVFANAGSAPADPTFCAKTWAARPPKMWPLRTGAAVARNPSPLLTL